MHSDLLRTRRDRKACPHSLVPVERRHTLDLGKCKEGSNVPLFLRISGEGVRTRPRATNVRNEQSCPPSIVLVEIGQKITALSSLGGND